MQRLRNIFKQLPTFLTALVLALVVWVIAVTANDPSVQKAYPSPIPIEIVGQSTDLVITSQMADSVTITLRAPSSVWDTLVNEKAPVRAIIDLSELGEGDHNVPVQIQIGVKPVELITYSPRSEDVKLEKLASNTLDITVNTTGNPTIGYQVGVPQLSDTQATVSGAESLVDQVVTVSAQLDVSGKTNDFSDTVTLHAYDQNGIEVKNITISPAKVKISESVVQLGGFRNVVVKVVTIGQVAMGYKLTSISVNPPTVTVYSPDPSLVEALPGYVETDPINLDGLKDDVNQDVNLRLGNGITLVGNPTVNVQVSIATVENSIQFSNVLVVPIGLSPNLQAVISPLKVDVIVSGPSVALNSVVAGDLRVQIDLTGYQPGTYTFAPKVSLNYPDLRIESIQPSTFQVSISTAAIPPTPTK